jgi:hypothetical protein
MAGKEDFLNKNTYSLEQSRSNWYKAKPYGFKFTDREGKITIMFLPISPSNLNISTDFATNIVTTLYGTVEEHSEVRYYDIVIEGTTGATPRHVNPIDADLYGNAIGDSNIKNERGTYGRNFTIINLESSAALGGFFRKTRETIKNVTKNIKSLTEGEQQRDSGVKDGQTGYLAFHNLYRFLLQYKRDAAGLEQESKQRAAHPLKFFNHKDNNEYSVAIRNFVLKRSAENPTLYYYQISMRGYKLSSINGDLNANMTYDSSMESELGLSGLNSKGLNGSSTLNDIRMKSNKVKSTLASIASGIRLFGR